jgi:hypothetical protein
MKIRCHRGTLEAAILTVLEIEPSISAVRNFLNEFDLPVRDDDRVEVVKYGKGMDERIGWDTHLVLVNGSATAFTDGPVA